MTTLTYSMKSNLLSLQKNAERMSVAQNNLATGLKVSSAVQNPEAYYVARSLSFRAEDLNNLLNNLGQSVQSLQAASSALKSGISFLQQAQAVANLAKHNINTGSTETPDEPAPPPTAVAITKSNMQEILNTHGISGIVVASKDELDNALLNAAPGSSIVILGHINLNNTALTVKSGTRLIGAQSVIDDNNLEEQYYVDSSLKASLSFDFSNLSSANAIEVESNTYVSDITINYRVESNTGSTAAIYANKAKNVVVNNVNINMQSVSGTLGNYMEGISNKTSEITLKGTINIKLDGVRNAALHSDYYGTFFQDADNTLNVTIVSGLGDIVNGGKSTLAGKINAQMNGQSGNIITAGTHTVSGTVNVSVGSAAKNFNMFSGSNVNFSSTAFFMVHAQKESFTVSSGNSHHTWQSGATISVKTPSVQKSWISDDGNYDGNQMVTTEAGSDLETVFGWAPLSVSITGDLPADDDDSKYKGNANLFNKVVNQYNQILNDASYKGSNLLKGNNLTVAFNPDRSNTLLISGKNLSSNSIGINSANWETEADIDKTLQEIQSGLTQLRNYSAELGLNYNIVSTRETFTERMVNVLTEGADKLTLADMNQESATILSLQTRQHLAISALALASQTAQAVLRLF